MQSNSKTGELNETRVVIVGAGPIGLELAVALTRNQIPFQILDAGTIGQNMGNGRG